MKLAGKTINRRYKVLEKTAAGGMSDLYRALDRERNSEKYKGVDSCSSLINQDHLKCKNLVIYLKYNRKYWTFFTNPNFKKSFLISLW